VSVIDTHIDHVRITRGRRHAAYYAAIVGRRSRGRPVRRARHEPRHEEAPRQSVPLRGYTDKTGSKLAAWMGFEL
jgi:hypothetical protein